jgi:hypothetical protein
MNEIGTKVKKEIIKPCPFCGGEADVESLGGENAFFPQWSVGCSDFEGNCYGYQSLQSFARRSEAIAAWNKRANECTCTDAKVVHAEPPSSK